MTTIITYDGRIAADRKIHMTPVSGEKYFIDAKTKIYKTDCGRAAFVFYHLLPTAKNIPIIMQGLLDALVTMTLNGTYPNIQLTREVVLVIPQNMAIQIAVKDTIYYFGKLETYVEDFKIKEKKPGELCDLYIVEVQPEDFTVGGTGEDYALGLHLADPTMSLEEMMRRIPTMDSKSSTDFDIVDSRKMKPLIPALKTRRQKNASRV